MAKITALTEQKDKTRANVYLDGVFVCGLEIVTIMKNNLKIGTEITEEKLEQLKEESDTEKANKYALSLVNRKRYTKKELITKLKNKDISGKVIFNIIEKMEEYGYVDDASYVRAYVNSTKNKSKKELEMALLNKGIDKSIIYNVLEDMEIDDALEAKMLAEKFMKYKEHTKENLAKLYAYLYRKGFSGSDIAKAMNDFNYDED